MAKKNIEAPIGTAVSDSVPVSDPTGKVTHEVEVNTADPKKHAGNRLVLVLTKDAAIGNGKRKAGTVIAYVVAAEGATLEEARQLINNPALQKVTREDAK